MMSQMLDTIKVRVRSHEKKLPRAQTDQHQAAERYLGWKVWVWSLQRKVGKDPPRLQRWSCYIQTQPLPDCQTCSTMVSNASQGADFHFHAWWDSSEVTGVSAHVLKPRNIHHFLNPLSFLSFLLRWNRLYFFLHFLYFLSLTGVQQTHKITPTQLPHFPWHDLHDITAMKQWWILWKSAEDFPIFLHVTWRLVLWESSQ